MNNSDFDRLVEKALAQDFSGWDFSWLHGRLYEEDLPDSHSNDIGAIVFFLKIIECQIPDFTPRSYHDRLLTMHRHIKEHGAFKAKAHRYLIQARKPR